MGTLGISGLSRSQVSTVAVDLDEQVDDFHNGPLDAGPHMFVAADALTMKVRQGGREVKDTVILATEVIAHGNGQAPGVRKYL